MTASFPLDTIHLWHHLQENRHAGVSMTHCHLFGNVSYFSFSQPVNPEGFQIFTISVPCLSVCSSINCHMVINVVGWVSLVLIKSHFMTKKLSLNMLGVTIWPAWGSHAGSLSMAKWESPCLLPTRVRGEVLLLSRPADVPKRAREPVFWATASPQNGVAHFKDQSSNRTRTCTLSWHIVFA